MIVETPARGIVHLKFSSQEEITHAMLRFSEFYESPYPEIRGKRFTVEEFLARYAKEYPDANYFEDWNGYNVPVESMKRFCDLYDIADLSKAEFEALAGFFDAPTPGKYLIATWRDSDFEHELAHGLYYVDAYYRNEVIELVYALKTLFPALATNIEEWLHRAGYARAVILDETNAYIATNATTDWIDDGAAFTPEALCALGHIRETFYRKFVQAQERNRGEAQA